ncbi:MAG TPA: DUF1801 domain-containing protein [Flavihumibacter sp.]|jgi:uncharacterized protein YdhG (YjbR/CyaY superfamily)
MGMMKDYQNVDAYISEQSPELQKLLKQMRATVRKAAPGAEEAIKYGMPTLVYGGNLLHFAACKNHIGFYPTPSGIQKFERDLKPYKTSKGAIQFPLNEPLPLDLVERITVFRVKENEAKAKAKAKAKA